MTRIHLLAVLLTAGGLSLGVSAAQGPGPDPPLRAIQHVKDNLYWIPGADRNTYPIPGSGYDPAARSKSTGGNTAVFVTDQGVVLVDTMHPGHGRELLAQVRSVTSKPVTMIINTHTHYDHAGSNTEFPATVEFVAHENTRKNLSKPSCPPVTHCQAFQGDNAKYLPKRTYADRLSLLTGKDRIELYYFGRGHTNGDSFVVFPSVRAMQTGDMFQYKNMPFIDAANNDGDALEFAETLRKAAATISGIDTVIAGHSPTLMTWGDFTEYTEYYSEFATGVLSAQKAGRSVEEAASAYKPAERFKNYEIDPARVKEDARLIYASAAKRRP